MQIAPIPPQEKERLAFLQSLEILDSEPEERFDSITRLACRILGAKYAAVSLIDTDRQWFKSACGLDVTSTSRDVSFCSHAILESQTMAVEDALSDVRFYDNPLVTDGPKIRAYLGCQLIVSGFPLGALCALFTEPRTFTQQDKDSLCDLARLTEELITNGRFRKKVGKKVNDVVRAGDEVVIESVHINSEPTMLINVNNWTVTDLNEACVGELGLVVDEVIEKPFPLTVQTTDRCYEDLQREYIQNKKVNNFEISVQSASGNDIEFLCTAVAVGYRNKAHILVTGRNISRLKNRELLLKKAKEQAEATCRAKSSFLANMSHELRTPMNSILGFTQLMACDESLGKDHKETLKIVNDGGEHLLQLINNVLEMSQIEAGQIKLVPIQTHLTNLIAGIDAMFSNRAKGKGLSLRYEVAPDTPEAVELDDIKIRQILINLVGNAIKFTDKGHVEIRLGVVSGNTPGNGKLLFEIEDTGKGIPEDARNKLFTPFEQIDRSKGLEGTGLGLSICQGYIDAMNGTISAEGNSGGGSTFVFTVPLIESKAEGRSHSGGGRTGWAAAKETGIGEGVRILVVDDMQPGRTLLKKLLLPLGFEVREAENGLEATRIDKEWAPHIILMDLRMPVMDGDEACLAIKAERGDASPAVIAITASVFREDLMSPHSHFDGCVSKPFRIEELIDELGRHVPVDESVSLSR